MPRANASRFIIVLGCIAVLACTAPSQDRPAATLGAPVPLDAPPLPAGTRPLPINLPTALQLAGVHALDIQAASLRLRQAAAQLEQANVLWLPSVNVGADYLRHDGRIQAVPGDVITTSRSSFLAGIGPNAVFALSDALFAPLAARQVVRAREADRQSATNNVVTDVAEAYFNVQQARGELAGAEDAARRAVELARRAEQLAPGLAPPVEAVRARAEAARRRQAVNQARERWQTTSAQLVRLLRLDPAALVEPLEPAHLRITLVACDATLDDLIPVGLTNRPELASRQALVQATLQRLKQEKLRPLVPSVLLRSVATNPPGLGAGVFGGGRNDRLSDFGGRSDFDLQVLWEIQNLGFGNRARVRERKAEHELALIELFRTQDQVAAEVAAAHAIARSAAERVTQAEEGLKDAVESVQKNFDGLGQTKRLGGDLLILVVRPAEVVAAVQALAQAYTDYYSAVGDANRAQVRLYRALGHPAQALRGLEWVQPACPPKGEQPFAP